MGSIFFRPLDSPGSPARDQVQIRTGGRKKMRMLFSVETAEGSENWGSLKYPPVMPNIYIKQQDGIPLLSIIQPIMNMIHIYNYNH